MNGTKPRDFSSNLNEHGGLVVLIAGGSGAGKTTLCEAVIAKARQAGYPIGGILSRALFHDGEKTGISAVNLRTMETKMLARRRRKDETRQYGADIDCWVFDEAILDWGNEVLGAATPCSLLVVDELGPLEWLHGRGWMKGLTVIDSAAYHTALVTIRPELLSQGIARWNAAKVVTIEHGVSLPVESVFQMVVDRLSRAGSATP